MIVCHCRAVSDRTVRESLRNGAADVAGVMAETGAGTCCGGCLVAVEELVVAEGAGLSSSTVEVGRRSRPLRLVRRSPERAA
jgi:bacterioferritin-associated ferredoxin